MAGPHGEVEVHGTVAANGAVAKGNPEALVAEIERTREDLARTIDDLAERVSPAGNLRLLKEKVAQEATRPEVQLGAAAVGLATVGLVVLRVWMRHRRSR
jgi:hypothetical protein